MTSNLLQYSDAKLSIDEIFRLRRKTRSFSEALMNALVAVSRRLRTALPYPTTLAYAYNPNEGASSRGGTHLIVMAPVRFGRIVRDTGDALCQPARKFWGLTEADDGNPADCKRCLEIAERITQGETK